MEQDREPSLEDAFDVADPDEYSYDSDSTQKSQEFPKAKPLPPISRGDSQESEESGTGGEEQGAELKRIKSKDFKASMAGSDKSDSPPASRGSRRPRIIQFRRETSEDSEQSEPKTPASGKHRVSFAENTSQAGSESGSVGVSVECQTEWSWLEDMRARHDKDAAEEPGEKSSEHSEAESGHAEKAEKAEEEKTEEPQKVEETVAVAAQPEEEQDDEYGIPVLEIEVGDSDFSDIDEDVAIPATSNLSEDEDEEVVGVGPPNILQYKRESAEKIAEAEDPEAMAARLREEQKYFDRVQPLPGTLCEYCGTEVKPFPTLALQEKMSPEELFCCDRYREFVHMTLTHPLNKKFYDDKEISVSPHPPHGSKLARKAAKERAAARMRERELQKQQAAAAAAATGMAPSGFYASATASNRLGDVARQMKTINYQLSSQRCLEEGWTLRVPSPLREEPEDLFVLQDDDDEEDEYRPDKLMDFSELSIKLNRKNQKPRKLIIRNYPDGQRFLVMFPNGSGNVFYQSGNLAISILRSERGRLSYLLHDDHSDRRPNLLGSFEPNGHGCCFFTGGAIRLVINPLSGIEHNKAGGRKRRWKWKEQIEHVHAPPFQPICLALNDHISVRVMSQENIALTFRHKDRSCRYNMGTKLKLVRPELLPKPESDPNMDYCRDVHNLVETLLTRVNNMIRFPKSTKLEKLRPLHQEATPTSQDSGQRGGRTSRKLTSSIVRVT